MVLRSVSTRRSKVSITTDVRATGLWSLRPVIFGLWGDCDDSGCFEACRYSAFFSLSVLDIFEYWRLVCPVFQCWGRDRVRSSCFMGVQPLEQPVKISLTDRKWQSEYFDIIFVVLYNQINLNLYEIGNFHGFILKAEFLNRKSCFPTCMNYGMSVQEFNIIIFLADSPSYDQ